MNEWQELQEILATMEVPESKKRDIDRLSRNISIRNTGNKNLPRAIQLIKLLKRMKWTNHIIISCKCNRSSVAVDEAFGSDTKVLREFSDFNRKREACKICGNMPVIMIEMCIKE